MVKFHLKRPARQVVSVGVQKGKWMGQTYSTEGKAPALHKANLDLILSIPMVPQDHRE